MHFASLRNTTQPLPAAVRIGICDSFGTRLQGWMFARSIFPDQGKLLDQGSPSRINASIHMLFVNFNLAVFWLDADLVVVDRVLARRWALFYQPSAPARYVLEVHPSLFNCFSTGDRLALDYD